MSYDIYLINPETKKVIELDSKHHLIGGTYVIGGTTCAEFNITWNYSKFFREQFGENGIRELYGKTVEETLPLLSKAIATMKCLPSENYWEPIEGNARSSLIALFNLATMVPSDSVWQGD